MKAVHECPRSSVSLATRSDAEAPRLTFAERQTLRLRLLRVRIKEYLVFDSSLFKAVLGLTAYFAAIVMQLFGWSQRSFLLLGKLHRADWLGLANKRAERLAREAAGQAAAGASHPILSLYDDHIARTARTWPAQYAADPARLLGPIVMVLKSPADAEKGVLLMQYSFTFPFFARHFDINQVASRYHIVLEPDWSGYCDLNVLSYTRFPFPVFVQAFEPRDADFVTRTNSNLVVVPTSTNWWVDHRSFRPLSGTTKEFDLVMVAGWGEYKRHFRFFHALARLRRSGHRPRCLLVGYPIGFTQKDVLRQASYYGVADQLEIHDSVPYTDVNEFVNRAKVNIIWSRKEGVNRAIIESMFAGLPCVVRDGFNYGYRYPYINEQTGCFVREDDLPERLLWMVENVHRFSPREWVLANMSCQRATSLLCEVIGKTAASQGEAWHGNLAVKVNWLNSMQYWNPEDAGRFEVDYEFLRSTIRSSPTGAVRPV